MNELAHPMKFLVGKRVYLRLPLEDDALHCAPWVNDQEVLQFLGGGFPKTLEAEKEWFKERIKKFGESEALFMVCLIEDDCPIGTMSFLRISLIDRTATTGACFGEKDCWGKGYGTEAKMLLLHWAFQELNLRKVNSEVISFNKRSQRYLEKCGYQLEGIRKKETYINGRYHDLIQVAVFKRDFMRLWKEYKKKHLS